MRTLLSLAAAAALTLGLVSGSFAATTPKTHAASKKMTASKTLKCPACGMTLSTKKTKATPKAVKINGKTYYCCAACNMASAKGATKGGTKKPAAKKGT